MKTLKRSYISVLALVALLALTGCGLPTFQAQLAQPVKAESALVSEVIRPKVSAVATPPFVEGEILDELESTLSGIYTSVNPSVVSIRVTKTGSGQQSPGFPFSQPQEPQDRPQTGAGSGFVWGLNGHITTNNHVIEGAEKIVVQFSDGRTADAEIVGTDPDSDLAVIIVDVNTEWLQPVTVNDMSDINVGQLAVAIGNPFGLDNTMTVGFISALGRSLPVDQNGLRSFYTIPNIIQTDAPINPGNSGGVLVNSRGEVIGVTTAIISPVQASAGIGFAVPADIVLKVVPELIANGSYKHAWLGLSGATLTSDVATAMDLPSDLQGVLVGSVIEEGPAETSGLLAGEDVITLDGINLTVGGDIITELDGESVRDFEDLVAQLSVHRAGEEVTLTIIRDGVEMPMNVTLGERPIASPVPELQGELDSVTPVLLGVIGIPLDEDIASVMDLDPDQKGVLVGQVQEGSVAAQAGVLGGEEIIIVDERRFFVGGDVITAWNDDPIETITDLRAKLAKTERNEDVTLTVIRDGELLTLTLEF